MFRRSMTAMLFLASLLAARQPAGAQGDSTTSLRDGVYTEQQARRGEGIYTEACADCHLPDFFKETFLLGWSGVPVSWLYDAVSESMPADRPGSLKDQEYADVLAYIFEMNGLPPGSHELRPEHEVLERILIERSE